MRLREGDWAVMSLCGPNHFLRSMARWKSALLARAFCRIALRRGPLFQLMPLGLRSRAIRLGSQYGGWWLVPHVLPDVPMILSCGLGEDASFDVECVNGFSARVIIYDPTPRAKEHFHSIVARLGEPSNVSYNTTGNQPIEAYDLSAVGPTNLVFRPVAVSHKSGKGSLHLPTIRDHVSGSLLHSWKYQGGSIDVECVRLSDEFEALDHAGITVDVLKLDIECAEVEVLEDTITQGWRPTQINVEYDELYEPDRVKITKVKACHELLTKVGYVIAASDHRSNFLYLYEPRGTCR